MRWSVLGAFAILLVPLASGSSSTTFGRSDWTVAYNANTSDSVDLVGTQVSLLATPDYNQLDFPYLTSQAFPATGDIQVSFTLRYTQLSYNGAPIVLLTQGGQILFWAWADIYHDETAGFFGGVGKGSDTSAIVGDAKASHAYTVAFSGTMATLVVDGKQLMQVQTHLRPASLWLGHPTIGQLYGLGPNGVAPPGVKVDQNGVVTGRWWGGGKAVWSALTIKDVTIQSGSMETSAPTSQTLSGPTSSQKSAANLAVPVLAAILLGLATARRRR